MTTKVVVDATCQIKNAHLKGRTTKGESACGVLVIDEKGKEYQYSRYLGEMTVPEAEFNGLIFALEQVSELTNDRIEVFMDSQLVIRWLTGEYRIKKSHIKPLFTKVKGLEKRFKKVSYFHHSRETEFGRRVDWLARRQLFKYF